MAKRGSSPYNQFIARRLKGTPSHQLPDAMRAAAADWRSGNHGGGGGRRNPGGASMQTLVILGVAGFVGYQLLKKKSAATPTATASTKAA